MGEPIEAQAGGQLKAWWLAIRPFSLPASVVPVLVGSAVAAADDVRPGLFILALVGSLLIHIGTNLATDFFDFSHGVQPGATLGGVIRSGQLSAESVHRAAIGSFVLGSLCGLVIVAFTGWPILAVGIASVLAGYFYTAKPISYGRRGLGELMVFLMMGPVMVMASYYVQLEDVAWRPFFASIPVGILVAAILHANNIRDIDNDRQRNKVTVATLLGRRVSNWLLGLLVAGAFLAAATSAALDEAPMEAAILVMALPAAISALRALGEEGPGLNKLVRGTARLHLHFGVLLAVAYVTEAAV